MKFLLKDHYQQNTTEGTREEPQIERGESVLKGSEIKKIGEFFMMVKAEIKLLKPGFEPQADMKLFKPRVRSGIFGLSKNSEKLRKKSRNPVPPFILAIEMAAPLYCLAF